MRHVLAAGALAVLLIAGAGCTDDGNKSGGSDPTVTTSAGASGASGGSGSASGQSGSGTATGADTQVCVDTEKLIADSTAKFGEELVKATQAGGDQAAVNAVKTLFAEWAAGLRSQAAKAANPDLKAALLTYATGLDKVVAQVNTFADLEKLDQLNTPEIESATEKISQICG